MNLGQLITAHSPLPTGTVAQHLAAMQFGTGPGETVFASRVSVVVGEDRVEVIRKAKRTSPEAAPKPRAQQGQGTTRKEAFAVTATPCSYVMTQADELVVVTKQQAAVATRTFDSAVVRKKGKNVH